MPMTLNRPLLLLGITFVVFAALAFAFTGLYSLAVLAGALMCILFVAVRALTR